MVDDAIVDLGKAGSFEPYKKEASMPYWKKFVTLPNAIFAISVILVLVYFFTLPSSQTINSNVVKSLDDTASLSKNISKLVEINYFYEAVNCTSCLEGKSFVQGLKDNNRLVKLNLYEMSYDDDNRELLKVFSKDYGANGEVVLPMTFIREKYFSGFTSVIGSEIGLYVQNLTSSD
ncbi:MAG: hypothetical protein AABW73_01315 [Nanoarchaeota archaeon]